MTDAEIVARPLRLADFFTNGSIKSVEEVHSLIAGLAGADAPMPLVVVPVDSQDDGALSSIAAAALRYAGYNVRNYVGAHQHAHRLANRIHDCRFDQNARLLLERSIAASRILCPLVHASASLCLS